MAYTVFLLHGMGLHPADWSDSLQKKLKNVYAGAAFGRMNSKAFGDRFNVVQLEYDSVFRDYVRRWSGNAAALLGAKPAQAIGDADQLLGWLTDAAKGDDNFSWSHAADVFMYRFFGSVRAQVKVHVANQIVAALQQADGAPWSIIAHSLGTAVAHDSLHALWSDGGGTDPDDPRVPSGYGAKDYPAQAVVMVANVGRALQTNPKVLEPASTVRPGPVGSSAHGCAQYLNIRHKYDPFTWVRPFDPDRWPTPESHYQHIQCDHLWDYNVHDVGHYLEAPQVHVPLFRAIAYDGIISQKEQAEAEEAFRPYKYKKLTDMVISKARGELEKLRPGGDAGWEVFPDLWDRFRPLLEKKIQS